MPAGFLFAPRLALGGLYFANLPWPAPANCVPTWAMPGQRLRFCLNCQNLPTKIAEAAFFCAAVLPAGFGAHYAASRTLLEQRCESAQRNPTGGVAMSYRRHSLLVVFCVAA